LNENPSVNPQVVSSAEDTGGRFGRMLSWLSKGIWTIADQALFAGSNFILSVLLARWLSEKDFGAYSIGLTIFWMSSTIHTGFLTEPMLVFGPGKFRDKLPGYSALILRGHAALTLVIGFLLAMTGLVFGLNGSIMLSQVFFALSVSQFFVLLMWNLRKACYVRLRPRVAAMGGAVYALIMLPSAYALFSGHMLNAWSAIGLLSIAAIVSSLVIMVALKINPFEYISAELMSETFEKHISYGKWAAVTGVITWIPEQLPFIMAGAWHGLDTTASVKALWNFAMPVSHACTAISVFLVPVFVRMRIKQSFFKTVFLITGVVTIVSAGYWLFIGLYNEPLMFLFYKGKYSGHSTGLWIVGAITVVSGILSILSACVRAMEKPQYVFWAYSASSVICLGPGMYLMHRYDVSGALLSIAVSLLAAAVFMTVLIVMHRRKRLN
jgi:O-antigen/teichoic acid export membrane protein